MACFHAATVPSTTGRGWPREDTGPSVGCKGSNNYESARLGPRRAWTAASCQRQEPSEQHQRTSLKQSAIPGTLEPLENVEKNTRGRKICSRFPFVIPRDPKGCSFMLDEIHPGYYHHVERQRQKASLPSNEPTTLLQATREIAALRVMRYEYQSQRFPGHTRRGRQQTTGEGVRRHRRGQ